MRQFSKNPISKLIRKADKTIQDYFRRIFRDFPCEVCEKRRFVEMHHFARKSESNFLRYHEKNLIKVCRICHSWAHGFDESGFKDRVKEKKGQEWFDWIEANKRKYLRLDEKYLELVIKKYN